MHRCWMCGMEVEPYSWNKPKGAHIECKRCGEYYLSEYLANRLREPATNIRSRYVYSAAIRDLNENGVIPWVEDLDKLLESVRVPAGPLESIDRILSYVYKKAPSAYEYIQVDFLTDYPVGYAKDAGEFEYFIEKAIDLGYFEPTGTPRLLRLGIEGWRRISELQKHQVQFDQAFVAMWFGKALDEAWTKGFRPALVETGYVPLRIDLSEHNEKIDDRIIAEIRKSGLVVADFTGQRGGVYFEAGFAMGLGTPLIWTCREDDIDKLHFGTRQYNHISWSSPADLKDKLVLRIQASIRHL